MSTSHDSADSVSRLQELRAAAVRRASSLQSGFDAIVDAASDVATDDEHDPEGHTIAWERQQVAGLLDGTRTALDEIDAALRRVDGGTYGTCTVCSGAISTGRLDALPATSTCVACAA